jgi:hypothetical protein
MIYNTDANASLVGQYCVSNNQIFSPQSPVLIYLHDQGCRQKAPGTNHGLFASFRQQVSVAWYCLPRCVTTLLGASKKRFR